MPVAEKVVYIEFSAAQMFQLVDAVEDYPQFMPWCSGASVDARHEDGLTATLKIDFHGLKQQFSTRNRYQGGERIDIQLVDGPFRVLDGSWQFKALGEQACKIEFRLHYEFTSKLLEKLVGPVFQRISTTFVDAFIHRAQQVYP